MMYSQSDVSSRESSWPTPTYTIAKANPALLSSKTVALPTGDSGSMVVLLHSGRSKGGLASAHVTYATPAWWLIGRIKAKYPHADFNRTTW
ncbi:hypothetical protein EI94DRAFT_1721569 [Lactarius quietus]|nr:hypothetical protein EI94DRAFT_1721569 [Lactarius quietus]